MNVGWADQGGGAVGLGRGLWESGLQRRRRRTKEPLGILKESHSEAVGKPVSQQSSQLLNETDHSQHGVRAGRETHSSVQAN